LQTERSVYFTEMKDTKDTILKTAYSMFLNNNYEAVTINSIIKAAGITKGGIYHYYASKEELFKAVVDKFLFESKVSSPTEYSSLNEFIQNTLSMAKEQIHKKAKSIEFNQTLPAQHISLFMAAFKYYPNFTKIGSRFHNNEVNRWKSILELAKNIGEIRDNVDAELMAMNFMVVGTNVVTNTLLGGSVEYAIEMYEKQLRELYKCIKN